MFPLPKLASIYMGRYDPNYLLSRPSPGDDPFHRRGSVEVITEPGCARSVGLGFCGGGARPKLLASDVNVGGSRQRPLGSLLYNWGNLGPDPK